MRFSITVCLLSTSCTRRFAGSGRCRWVWRSLAGFGVDYLLRLPLGRVSTRGRFDLLHILIVVSAVFGAAILILLVAFLDHRSTELSRIVDRLFHGLALADTAFADARAFYSYEFWQFLILG